MKRLLITVLMMVLVFSFASARKTSKKAGKITDGVFLDNKYDYSLGIPDEWNSSIHKDKSRIRLVLTKKQYDVPMAFQGSPTYTKIPKITVYLDTSSVNLDLFVDSLLNDKFKSKQKKSIMEECEILYGDYTPKKRAKMSVGDVNGILIAGEKKYTVQIPNVVTDYHSGALFFAKNNNNLLIFHFISEKLYFDDLFGDFMGIMNTLKFTETTDDKKEGKK